MASSWIWTFFFSIYMLHNGSEAIPKSVTETDCGDCIPEMCAPLPQNGCTSVHTVTDECGCCPTCLDTVNETDVVPPDVPDQVSGRSCASVKCGHQQQCFLNVQGLPICRCPSAFICKRQPKNEICGRDGVTYHSRCYMQVAECSLHKKIRVDHRGPCEGGDSEGLSERNSANPNQDGRGERMDRKRKKPVKRKPGDTHTGEHALRNRKRVERKKEKVKRQKQQDRVERKMKKRKLRKSKKRGSTLEDVQWQDYSDGTN